MCQVSSIHFGLVPGTLRLPGWPMRRPSRKTRMRRRNPKSPKFRPLLGCPHGDHHKITKKSVVMLSCYIHLYSQIHRCITTVYLSLFMYPKIIYELRIQVCSDVYVYNFSNRQAMFHTATILVGPPNIPRLLPCMHTYIQVCAQIGWNCMYSIQLKLSVIIKWVHLKWIPKAGLISLQFRDVSGTLCRPGFTSICPRSIRFLVLWAVPFLRIWMESWQGFKQDEHRWAI